MISRLAIIAPSGIPDAIPLASTMTSGFSAFTSEAHTRPSASPTAANVARARASPMAARSAMAATLSSAPPAARWRATMASAAA